MKKKKDNKKTPTTGIGNITNESRGRNKQNAQTTYKKQNKIHHKSQLKEQEKKNCTNSQATKGRSLHNITPHVSPLMVPGLAFVLYRHVNLNKERNKRARCLRVYSLA